MANTKISALTGATTPLAGTEVLPIVQSSTTKQVSIANLTAGRTQTSNGIVQGTAATGYNFTANTPASGMTSQLLNWYEQGTWTPLGNGITYVGSTAGRYTRIGNLVTCTFRVDFPVTANTSAAQIQSLPFNAAMESAPTFGNYSSGFNGTLNIGNTFFSLVNTTGTAFIANSTLSGQILFGSISYQV
jgi:hypothetical protein